MPGKTKETARATVWMSAVRSRKLESSLRPSPRRPKRTMASGSPVESASLPRSCRKGRSCEGWRRSAVEKAEMS